MQQIFNLNQDQCYGCGACAQKCVHNAILMTENVEGFLYPTLVENNCIDCGLCNRVCPAITPILNINHFPTVYAAYNKDKQTVYKSSSGGLFSLLADFVIKNRGVVFGVVQDDDFVVRYSYTDNYDGIDSMRGSKYVQAEVGTVYTDVKRFLKEGRKVLFTGTPCQIGGLLGFLGNRHENLLTSEVICHGAPSQKLLRNYCIKIGYDISIPTKITFRDLKIWNYMSKVNSNNRNIILFGKRDYYMKSFFKNITFRESCYKCQYASLPRIADLTIADFWGINKKSKGYNQNGTSLILVNSKYGEDIFNQIKSYMVFEERSLNEAKKYNHNIVQPTNRPANRDTFYPDHEKLTIDEINDKYHLNPTLRNYIGFVFRTFRRLTIK